MGAKSIPIKKKVGSTVLGVSMGCHAFNLCCLKAVLFGKREVVQRAEKPFIFQNTDFPGRRMSFAPKDSDCPSVCSSP